MAKSVARDESAKSDLKVRMLAKQMMVLKNP
jgi:hypothetical protein